MLLDESEVEEASDFLECFLFASRNNQLEELIDKLSFRSLCDF